MDFVRRRRERLDAQWEELSTVETETGRLARLLELVDECETAGDFDAATDALAQLASLGALRDDSALRLMGAWISTRAGDAESARRALEALSAPEDPPPAEEGRNVHLAVQIALAGHAAARGNHAEALTLLDTVFEAAREDARTSIKAHVLTLVGCVYATRKSVVEARDLFSRAVLLHQRAGDAEAVGKVYNNIGVCHYLDGGRFVDAIPFLELGLDFVSGRGDTLVVLNVLSNNIRAFESAYSEQAPAGELRARARDLATSIPKDGAHRLSDLSVLDCAPVKDADESSAEFTYMPVVTGPLLFWTLPRWRTISGHLLRKVR